MSKSIQSLFKIDFANSPDENFHEQGEPKIIDNQIVRTYSNFFVEESDYEFGLFDTIDIKTFQNLPNKNFIFTNEVIAIGEDEIELIKKLTNEIHSCYGKDEEGRILFSQNDIEDIELGYWSKSWSNHKNPIMLSFDDENGLSLTIWITE